MGRAIDNEYFKWLCQIVNAAEYCENRSFDKMLGLLHSIDFYYSIAMDANRAGDGVNMRHHFKYVNGYDPTIDILPGRQCSVLEMMVGLSVRCETQIMYDPEYGDRTGLWFWGMIENLGLGDMDDDNFDAGYATSVILRFLDREYEPNGRGGLFTVERSGYDMRDVEIWYQMNWYLNDI